MSNVIYKAALVLGNDFSKVSMPAEAKVLCTHVQGDNICIWFLCDPEETTMIDRYFEAIGTGWHFNEAPRSYIGTVLDGLYVWHVFEVLW